MPAADTNFARGALALIVLAGGILLITFISDLNGGLIQDLGLIHPGIDKLAHFSLHLILVGALFAILRRYWPQHSAAVMLSLAAGVSVVIGLLDEGHQYFISGRDLDPFDVAANLCGTATAVMLYAVYRKRSLRRLALVFVPLTLFTGILSHAHTQMQHFNEGLLQVRAGDYAGARKSFLTALAQGQASPGLYNELAWIELEFLNVDPASALRYTSQAVAYEADNPEYLDTHGWALYSNGRYEEALKVLLEAYAGDPDIYCIHYHLGATYLALGRHAQAFEELSLQLTRSTDARFAEKSRTLLAKLRNRKDTQVERLWNAPAGRQTTTPVNNRPSSNAASQSRSSMDRDSIFTPHLSRMWAMQADARLADWSNIRSASINLLISQTYDGIAATGA